MRLAAALDLRELLAVGDGAATAPAVRDAVALGLGQLLAAVELAATTTAVRDAQAATLSELVALRVPAARAAAVGLAQTPGLRELVTTSELAPSTVGIAASARRRHGRLSATGGCRWKRCGGHDHCCSSSEALGCRCSRLAVKSKVSDRPERDEEAESRKQLVPGCHSTRDCSPATLAFRSDCPYHARLCSRGTGRIPDGLLVGRERDRDPR